MAIERPKYTVELNERPFEVRTYLSRVVATVHADGDRSDAVNAGFRILAGYIFGDNRAAEKIAMTAPVTQSAGQAIAVPPHPQETDQRGWDVRFTMPSGYALKTLPTPRDGRISLVQTPSTRMACVTFSGFWTDSNFQSHQEQLRAFLEKHRFTAISNPVYAYYNAPWTPWFLRTNEVLIEIE